MQDTTPKQKDEHSSSINLSIDTPVSKDETNTGKEPTLSKYFDPSLFFIPPPPIMAKITPPISFNRDSPTRKLRKPISRKSSLEDQKSIYRNGDHEKLLLSESEESSPSSSSYADSEQRRLHVSIQQYEKQIAALKEQLDNLKQSYQVSEEKVQKIKIDYKTRLETLQTKLKNSEKRIVELTTDLDSMVNSEGSSELIIELKSKLKNLSEEHRRAIEKTSLLEEQRDASEASLQEVLDEIDEKDTMILQMKEKNYHLQQELKKVTDEAEERKAEIEDQLKQSQYALYEERQSSAGQSKEFHRSRELQNEFEDLQTKYHEVLLEVSQLKSDLATREKFLGQSNSRMKSLEMKYAEVMLLNDQLVVQVEELQNQLHEMDSIRDENMDLKTRIQVFEEQIAGAREISESFESTVMELENERLDFKAKFEDAVIAQQIAETKLAEFESQSSVAKEEVKSLKSELEQRAEKLSELEKTLRDYESKHLQLLQEKEELFDAKEQMDILTVDMQNLQNQHEIREKELKNSIEKLSHDLENSEFKLKDIEASHRLERDTQENQIEDVEKLKQDLKAALAEKETIQMEANKCTGLQYQIDELKSKLNEAHSSSADKEAELLSEIQNLQVTIESMKQNEGPTKEEHDNLKTQLEESLLQSKKLEETVTCFSKEKEELQMIASSAEGFKFQLDMVSRQLMEATSEFASQKSNLMRELEDAKADVAARDVSVDVDALKEELSVAQEERDQKDQEIQMLIAKANELEQAVSEMSNLEEELNNLKSQNERLSDECNKSRGFEFQATRLMRELMEKESKWAEKEQEYISSAAKLSTDIESSRISKQSVDESLARAIEEVDYLRVELQQLKSQQESEKNRILEFNEVRVKELESLVETLRMAAEDDAEERYQLISKMSELKEASNESDEKLQVSKRTLDEYQKKNAALEGLLEAKEEEIMELISSSARSRSFMEEDTELERLNELQGLKDELSSTKERSKELEAKIIELQEEKEKIQGHSQETKELFQEVEILKQELEKSKQSQMLKEKQVIELKDTLKILEKQASDVPIFEKEVEALRIELKQTKDQLEAEKLRYSQLRNAQSVSTLTSPTLKDHDRNDLDKESMEREIVDLKGEVERLKSLSITGTGEINTEEKMLQMQEELTRLRESVKENDEMKQVVNKMKSHMNQIMNESKEAERRLSISRNEKDAELARMHITLNKKEMEMSQLEEKLNQTEFHLKNVQKNSEKYADELEQLKKEKEELQKTSTVRTTEFDEMKRKVRNFDKEKSELEESMMKELLNLSMKANEARTELEEQLKERDRKIKELMSR